MTFSPAPSPIFALVIGIDTYKSGGIWNLHSCVDDAERVRRWLTHDLDVPKDQVRLLSDSQATKENIENAFMEHLVNNPSIQPDDAILIFFAGHGSRVTAPKDWYHGVRKPRSVEVLCTYDFDCKDAHGRVAGISDRSMHAMLKELAAVKGDNVTLMLDCCFSPSQTPENIRERSRTRWTPPTRAVGEDLNRGLWPGAHGLTRHSQFSFLEPSPTSHVVIAACSPGHIATEGKEGGRFTNGFLQAVQSLTLHHTTYPNLVDYMNRQAAEGGQVAVCLGKHKGRVVFNDVPFTIDPQFVSITAGRGGDLRIEAGSIHGIVEKSEFYIHSHNYRCSRNPSFATAVVVRSYSTWSLARIKSQESNVPRACWGRIMRWNNPNSPNRFDPFTFKIKSSVAALTKGWKLKKELPLGIIKTLKASGIPVRRVKTAQEAQVSVTMYRRSVVLERHDSIIGVFGERTLRLPDANPMKVLNDAAQFSWHLRSTNPEKPLESTTRVEVYNIHPEALTKVGANLLRDNSAVIHCNYDPIFTVTLRNTSSFDLWPYLVSFDPSNYNTTMIYPYTEDEDQYAPLPAGGTLEIAASWPDSGSARGGYQSEQSGFVKIYLASTSVRLNAFEQCAGPPPALALPRVPSTFMDGASIASSCQTLFHVWDTIRFHVTFVPLFEL